MKNGMKKGFVALAGALSAASFLSGCGDDITQITNSDLNAVASFKDLGDCDSKSKGRLVYVDSTESVYLCADSAWKEVNLSEVRGADGKDGVNGKDGADGKDGANGKDGTDGKDGKDGKNGTNGSDGKDGTSCTVEALDDGSGYDVLCGGEKVGELLNGKDGEKGDKGSKGDKGNDGKNCTVKVNTEKNGYDLVCGDSVVTVTNGKDGKSVTGPKGESCTGETLDNGNIQISCGGKAVGELKNGAQGAAGKSCTVKANEEKNGYDLICGDSVVTVTNGKDGKSVTGAKGESCTGKTLDNGNIQISCGGKLVGELKNGTPGAAGKSCTVQENKEKDGYDLNCDGKVVTIANGKAGAEGKSAYDIAKEKDPTIKDVDEWLASLKGESGEGCTVEKVSNGVKVTCDGKSQTITNGTKGSNGTSCFIASDVDGVVTLQCGEGDNSKTTKLYKAMCGTKPYDPEVRTCENQVLWGKCGDGKFNEETQFCGADEKPYDLCGGKTYDTETRTCEGGKIIGKCGEKTYNVATEVCHDDANSEVWKLCGTEPYDPKTKVCESGSVSDRFKICNGIEYDSEYEFCAVRDEIVERLYKKVTITVESENYSRTWMAENLNYQTENSWCGGGDGDNEGDCTVYGRLYTWDDASTACPDGWHLPTKVEWTALINAVGDEKVAGQQLKAKTGWEAYSGITNENAYGFSALPAGIKLLEEYIEAGTSAFFWSSEVNNISDAYADYILLTYKVNDATWRPEKRWHGLSVRCIQDVKNND
jgi:uncharacterized protein (TIGR02145 family)